MASIQQRGNRAWMTITERAKRNSSLIMDIF